MGHFAKVVNGKVVQVIVADQEFMDTFVDNTPGEWLKTSYNTRGGVHYDENKQPDGGVPFRKNFAGIGYSYDKNLDAFIPIAPYPSWVLNPESCLWNPPVEYPTDGLHIYKWDEATVNWVIDDAVPPLTPEA